MGLRELTEAMEEHRPSEMGPLGALHVSSPVMPGVERMKVRYLVGNMADEGDRALAESIMTQSLQPGSKILIMREDSTFTKTGEYIFAIKYGEISDDV
jgi:hypothetical protein